MSCFRMALSAHLETDTAACSGFGDIWRPSAQRLVGMQAVVAIVSTGHCCRLRAPVAGTSESTLAGVQLCRMK